MKYLVVLLLTFQVSIVSCQTNKRNLYLLFKKDNYKMYLYPYKDGTFDTYVYRIHRKDRKGCFYDEIYFDSQTVDEKGLKNRLYKKTVNLTKLKNYDIKDFQWLEYKINSFKPFQRLYQLYHKMYVVQIDSINKKAFLTEVNNIEIIE